MRPSKKRQSALWTPLNNVLGTEGNVRILRVLARTRRPMGKADVARRAELDPSGVRRALESLMTAGVVEAVGSGSRPSVALRETHPLVPALREIFEAEHRRAREVYDALRTVSTSMSPPPQAVWIGVPEHATPEGEMELIQVYVLDKAREVDELAARIRRSLVEVAGRYDVQFDVRPITRADIVTLPSSRLEKLAQSEPVHGPSAGALFPELIPSRAVGSASSHQDLDQRSIQVHRAIAERIRRDPTLVDRAREQLRGRLGEAPAPERKELQEWLDLIDTMPVERMRRLLVHPGERATRLRQSSPFLSILTPEEREQVQQEVHDAA